jgi:hypothetical protein
MTGNKETKDVVVGMRPSDYYIDTRKLQFLKENLNPDLTGHPGIKYTNLGNYGEEYAVSSLNSIKYLSSIVDIAESLGLSHENRFIDCISIKLSFYFYITNTIKGDLILVSRYHEGSYISPSTLKELFQEGYNLEFDGTLIFITLENSKGIREDILSLKALSDKFPNGFHK